MRKPKPRPETGPEKVARAVADMRAAVGAEGFPGTLAPILEGLAAEGETLAGPRYDAARRPLEQLREAAASGNRRVAERCLARLHRLTLPVANDRPFELRDAVGVVRSRHGWHDGRLEGVVTSRHQSGTGKWSYGVTDAEGGEHEVDHTRNLRPR